MIRTETERQFYLSAAGIRMWYARTPLPGAAPSPDFEFPAQPTPVEPLEPAPVPTPGSKRRPGVKTSPSQPAARDSGARIADLQALMGEQPDARKAPVPEPVVSDRVPEAPEEPAREATERLLPESVEALDIRVWAGDRVALIADLSADASLRLQEALAANILASLGEKTPGDLGRVGWPVFNNLRVPGNSRENAIEVLRSVFADLHGHGIIVLGKASGSGVSRVAEALGQSPAVSFPHALAELAGDPGLKRMLWQQIKPLASR